MKVSRDFIDEMVMSYHESFVKGKNWCKIATLAPVNESYKYLSYQKLYALRFIPAYYFEYCALADELCTRLNELKVKSVTVASLGCGLCPDYYALNDNMKGVEFDYVGFDRVHWSTRRLMPDTGENFTFDVRFAHALESEEISSFDVFVFPKSIRDIAESSDGALERLAQSLAGTSKKRIYFMNSFVCTKGQRSLDVDFFNVIHEALVGVGFECLNDHEQTYFKEHPYTKAPYAALNTINRNFVYPNEGRIVCPNVGEMDECGVCNVIKSPIFSNEFMDYQLLEYVRG
ncbi:hypothetical protein [Pseudomonas sp. BW7P1]|uniref:hypothetical protein n=1 Tax=Pseudomonas TaxID=286 RepID=UPI0021AD880F|nr:hypothetical protein [Pseudomonas sp. BW7P1]UWI60120.1 hypothetical protein NWV16_18655 [Pseudomonas sp. BW7P1]